MVITKNGFKEISSPITEASVALDKYTESLKRFNKESRERKVDEILKKNFSGEYFFGHGFTTSPFDQFLQDMGRSPSAPDAKDFPGLEKDKADSVRNSIITEKPVASNNNTEDILKQIRDGIYNLNGGRKGPVMPGRSTTGGYA